MSKLKVFVYGTLKPGEINYLPYCQGKVIEVSRAYTLGKLYHLCLLGYPGLTVGNEKIQGFLLSFVNEMILERLDQLESYQPQRLPEQNEYNRQKIPVYDLSGQPLGEAWGYLMSLKKVQEFQGVPVPSGWWTSEIVDSED